MSKRVDHLTMELAHHPHLKPLLSALVSMPPDKLESLSIEELSDAAHWSPRTVQRKLKILSQLGVVELSRPHDGRGGKYRFYLHPVCFFIVRSSA